MSNLKLHFPQPRFAGAVEAHKPLGQHLLSAGHIAEGDLVHALELQRQVDAPLGEILISEGLTDRHDVMQALATQHNTQLANLLEDPPDVALAARLPVALCLQYKLVPWMAIGSALMVATSRPSEFGQFRTAMGLQGLQMLPVVADAQQVQDQISHLYGQQLIEKAATRVPASQSCRTWAKAPLRRPFAALVLVVSAITALMLAPLWTLTIAMLFAFVTLVMSTTLKLAALWSQITHRGPEDVPLFRRYKNPFRMPRVSIMVPLLHEKEIAGALITRLSRLTYPKSLLDVVLVLEEEDDITHATLARTKLPTWISVIQVPKGDNLTTKPRALNYALDFCEGSIIGVWDAEDAPQPDQIERIVTRFQTAPRSVACLQGILDYYNPRANWLSRCFTIEYAAWWRVVLPGIARLGLVIPLGGTTLFFRRDILEELGATAGTLTMSQKMQI
jgi:hypothetical protein